MQCHCLPLQSLKSLMSIHFFTLFELEFDWSAWLAWCHSLFNAPVCFEWPCGPSLRSTWCAQESFLFVLEKSSVKSVWTGAISIPWKVWWTAQTFWSDLCGVRRLNCLTRMSSCLFLVEQFKNCLPKEIAMWWMEYHVTTLSEAAIFADEYARNYVFCAHCFWLISISCWAHSKENGS